jgi:hypothetical protein
MQKHNGMSKGLRDVRSGEPPHDGVGLPIGNGSWYMHTLLILLGIYLGL